MSAPVIRIRRKPASLPLNVVHCGDVLTLAKQVPSESAQIIIADPPYDTHKEDFAAWTDKWVIECLRILRDDGTMFIYGPSEHLAQVMVRLPPTINRRWLVWHYTNKSSVNATFWQHSHESILAVWKRTKVFHADAIREPYCDNYKKYCAGKVRKATTGLFSDGTKETVYNVNERGALPRDVIKIPALAGGAGRKERVAHPHQKPIALAQRLIESCQQPAANGFVFVPFAGSGTECVAARSLSLPFLGIEIEPAFVDICAMRLTTTTTEETAPDGPEEQGAPEATASSAQAPP